MSVKIMGLVWDLDNSEIDREEKYILLAYADHADHKGYNIFPSIDLICQKTGYKERAAQLITHSLQAKGFLVEDGKGRHGTNKWYIPLDSEGVKIAPVKNAPVQKTAERGAKFTVQGVQQDAPEPLKPYEPPEIDIKELKDSIWESILTALSQTVNRNTMTFIRAARPVSFENDILILGAIDETARDWLIGNARKTIESTFPGIIKRPAKVEFITAEAE